MKILENQKLSEMFWYRIGGVARYVAQISSKEDFYETMSFIKKNNITKIFFAGTGTNLIFSDDFFDGIVLQFVPNDDGIRNENENSLSVFAGQSLDQVINFGFDNNLIGLEWAGGLPGTVGAAVRGNVGAFGGEIKDVFIKAHCINLSDNGDYEEIILTKEDMNFSYRSSRVKSEKLIVLEALFELKRTDSEDIFYAREIYNQNIKYRKTHHPLEYPNCGSVFKNISEPSEVESVLRVWPDVEEKVRNNWHGKVSMGYIIGRLGFTGLRVGGAQISDKHQNFIVNLNNATSHDVKKIIVNIEKTVQSTFGFTPEIEVEVVVS